MSDSKSSIDSTLNIEDILSSSSDNEQILSTRSKTKAKQEKKKNKTNERTRRTRKSNSSFKIADEFTIIYPANSTLALRADEKPYFYLARIHDDITRNISEFAITWFDCEDNNYEYYDLSGEDIAIIDSVICRIHLIHDKDKKLFQLPNDEKEKIENIQKTEKKNSDYEYHSSDERLDEKTYIERYLKGKKPNIVTPFNSNSKTFEENNKSPPSSPSIVMSDNDSEPYEEPPFKKIKLDDDIIKSTKPPKRSRGRPRKTNLDILDDIDYKLPRKQPKKTTTKRKTRSPKREKSPKRTSKTSKSPRRTSKSPRRKKNEPNLAVKVVDTDITYCNDSIDMINNCCIACTTKIEPLRATLLNDVNLLNDIITDTKSISTLSAPRSVNISTVTPITVAIRRALLTVPESPEDIQKAITLLENNLEEKAEAKKTKSTTNDNNKDTQDDNNNNNNNDTNIDDKMDEDSDSDDKNNDNNDNNDTMDEDKLSISLDMIENRESNIKKQTPLEKIVKGDHNNFTILRMLLESTSYDDRVYIPDPILSKLSTGKASRYSHYRANSNVGISRGGKEGNNALLHDSCYYGYNSSNTRFNLSKSIERTLILPNVSFPSLLTLYYLNDKMKSNITDCLASTIRAGNRRLAARMLNEFTYYPGMFNFLHYEVLTYEHNQELSPIRTPLSIIKKGIEGITPLHFACIQSSSKYLEELLKRKPDALSVIDQLGAGLIHYAAASESPEPLKFLLKKNAPISTDYLSPLIIATKYDRIDNIKELLNNKESVEIKILLEQPGKDKNNALHYAAKTNKVNSIHILCSIAKKTALNIIVDLTKEAEGKNIKRKPTTTLSNYIDKPNRLGQTPLALAAMNGNYLAVKHLIDLGAKIDKHDKQGRTPLIYAIMNGCLQIISYLIQKGANPEICDTSNNSCVHYAAAYGWLECLKFLLSPIGTNDKPLPGAGLSANVYNNWKMSPLGIAIAKGHLGIADELLKDNTIDVNITDDEGKTLIVQTCTSSLTNNSLNQLKFLIEAKGDVNIIDINGKNALHHLIKQSPKIPKLRSRYHTVTNELEKYIDEKEQEEYNNTNNILCSMVEILLDNNINPNLLDNKQNSPLQLAIKHTNQKLINILILNKNIDLSFIDIKTGENILHILLTVIDKIPLIDVFILIKSIIGQSSYDLLLQSEDYWGFTPFLYFFRNTVYFLNSTNNIEKIQDIIKFFLESTEIPLLTQTVGKLKQWREVSDDILQEKVDLLLNKKKQEYIKLKEQETINIYNDNNNDNDNNNGSFSYSSSQSYGRKRKQKKTRNQPIIELDSISKRIYNEELNEIIKKYEDNVKKDNKNNIKEELLLSFLDDKYFYNDNNKSNINIIEDRNIDYTISNGIKEYYQEENISLIHPGYGNWGMSCILHMLPCEEEIIDFIFLNYEKQLNHIKNQYNVHGFMPIHSACKSQNYYFVEKLINIQANIDIPCKNKPMNYPIHYATSHQQKNIIQLLLNTKCSIDPINSYKQTPLSIASLNRWKKGVLIFLKAGANVNHCDIKNRSPLHLAIRALKQGVDATFDIEEILINKNIDVNIKDSYKRTALHYAFYNQNDPNDMNKYNNSSSSNILFNDTVSDPIETVSSLCAVDNLLVDEEDCNGNTPLCYAAQNASTISCLYLLKRNANVNHKNHNNNTPVSIAMLSNWPDFAIVLIQQSADINSLIYKVKSTTRVFWKDNKVLSFTEKEIKTKSLFYYTVSRDWQGVAYTLLDNKFTYEKAIQDSLLAKKFNYIETLLRKTRSIKEFTIYNSDKQNLLHILAIVCSLNDGIWSVKIAKEFRKKNINPSDIDNKGRTILHYAAIAHNYELCHYLLSKKDEIIQNYDSDDEDLMDIDDKINKGCEQDPNLIDKLGLSPFMLLFTSYTDNINYKSFLKIIELFISYGADTLCLFPSIHKDFYKITTLISPLHHLLLESKGNNIGKLFKGLIKDPINIPINRQDSNGCSILFLAVQMNLQKWVNKLIRYGISLDLVDNNKKTIIHYVIEPLEYGSYENIDILDILIKAKAPYNEKDKFGLTPIDYAYTKQTSKKLFNYLSTLNIKPNSSSIKRIPTMIPKKTEFPEIPDIEHDSKQSLQLAITSIEEQPIKIDKGVKGPTRTLYYDEESNKPYHILLTKVDVKRGYYGENSFYKLQIIYDTLKDLYILLNRWGRIGEIGQHQVTPYNNKYEAINEYKKLFKLKTGNIWDDNMPNSFIKKEGKYQIMKENRKRINTSDVLLPIPKVLEEKILKGDNIPICKLHPDIIRLMDILCDVEHMKNLLKSTMNLSLPLGSLTNDTIDKALQKLFYLHKLIKQKDKNQQDYDKPIDITKLCEILEKITKISNEYFELIPQDFNDQTKVEPILTLNSLQEYYKELIQLRELTNTSKYLLGAQYRCRIDGTHPFDYIYSCLSTLIKPLDKTSNEYKLILQSLNPEISIKKIYSIQRYGEPENISKWIDVPNHQLLWHGTHSSNILGILSSGLKIAPPEAPITGMLYGRGIYHSDSFEKSFQYCCGKSKIMLLNEVVVGKPYYLTEPEYMEKAPFDYNSTIGLGKSQPDPLKSITLPNGIIVHNYQFKKEKIYNDKNIYDSYNQIIVYDASQVRLRYIVLI